MKYNIEMKKFYKNTYGHLLNLITMLKDYGRRHYYFKKKVMGLRISRLAYHGVTLKHLSKKQKKLVREIYFGEHFLYELHEIYLTVNEKFDPWLFPEDLFRIKYEPKLNDPSWAIVCFEKSYFERFMPNVRFPKTILRSIEGLLYDADFDVITKEAGRKILNGYKEVVFKPSDNMSGEGVSLMKPEEVPLDNTTNYVIQERIVQHPVLGKLNESSVNIVRIITLLKETEVIFLSATLRIGAEGLFVDNMSKDNGLGMICVGIDNDGRLKETGYFSCALTTKLDHDGNPLKGIEIPKYKEMIEIAVKNHPVIPKIRFIGWDFTVDSEGNVIVMEINPKYPGVFNYQLANGPLFGERSEEIYNWMKTL